MNSLEPRLLVITPTLGKSDWLGATVRSVREFAPGSQHVLVAPAAQVLRLEKIYPDLRVVPEGVGGMYAAINTGIAAGEAWDLFTYINDDDLLQGGFPHARLRISTFVGPAIVYGNVQLINSGAQPVGRIPVSRFPALNRTLYSQRLEPVYQHGTVFNRAAMRLLGQFDESLRFCGDSEILARACLQGISFEYISGAPVAAFRLQPTQLTKNRPEMQKERASIDEKLHLLESPGLLQRSASRAVFRGANLPIYLERVRRHGWKTFDEILESVS